MARKGCLGSLGDSGSTRVHYGVCYTMDVAKYIVEDMVYSFCTEVSQ